ncbi:MAG: tRNA uridine-5-carboxymethylaminomethyl(34) synthesis GTPase MnmE [Rhodospirillaceae bacterium]|nr:tRNA uridine-5-carboxymethylaminomethyl(34) synthesis GTPase MnmE [Rhodospirillaceae bacterium]
MSGDTIYALSSGAGQAGVAVVRLSGPDADALLADLGVDPLPVPRRADLHRIVADGKLIDRAIVLRFPAPGSFTGEDVAELHVHGGPAVLDALFSAIGGTGRARLAEPGEFTRRAFENGKLDLTAAEGLADLVAAQTDAQRRLALRQYDGTLADLYEGWRARLVELMGCVEAEIDFSDEELPDGLRDETNANIAALRGEITEHLRSAARGERIRTGFPIVILGAPNVGKSSIINNLSNSDVAIVSETAGTTRDVIEVQLNLGGFAVTLSDTAGIRAAADGIEAEGVRRAEQRASDAALRLVVLDASEPEIPERVRGLITGDCIVVANKTDLLNAAYVPPVELEGCSPFPISAATGEGLDTLLARLSDAVRNSLADSEGALPTRRRHRDSLTDARDALGHVADAAFPELAAEDVRVALRALGRITGRVDIDEVLDTVFRDFCIGK